MRNLCRKCELQKELEKRNGLNYIVSYSNNSIFDCKTIKDNEKRNRYVNKCRMCSKLIF